MSELAWGGDCEYGVCEFDYMLPSNFKLRISLPSTGRTYVSDEQNRTNFDSVYEANIHSDGTIDMEETTPFLVSDQSRGLRTFLTAIAINSLIEMAVAWVFVASKAGKIRKRIMLTFFAVNVASLPLVWFVFPAIIPDFLLMLFSAELFVITFETIAMFKLNEGVVSLKDAAVLCLISNLVSFFIGGSIFSVFTLYF